MSIEDRIRTLDEVEAYLTHGSIQPAFLALISSETHAPADVKTEQNGSGAVENGSTVVKSEVKLEINGIERMDIESHQEPKEELPEPVKTELIENKPEEKPAPIIKLVVKLGASSELKLRASTEKIDQKEVSAVRAKFPIPEDNDVCPNLPFLFL